ncbi:MAG: hypothetical protein K2I93_03175, partial [Oscillospiraceae bacterium]|nr:hypothetical protein [Oscillospiraceae bacterium]
LVLSENKANVQYVSLYSITDDTLISLDTDDTVRSIGGTQTEDGYRLFFSKVSSGKIELGSGTYTIVDYDSRFQEISSQDVTADYLDMEETNLIAWYSLSNGGQLLLDINRHLHYYDADGVYQGMITGSVSGICSVYERNDKIYVICAVGSYFLGEIHLDTCSAELLEIPGMPNWCTGMSPGEGDYDVYFQDDTYLYGTDIAAGKTVLLVNFNDSDLSGRFEYMIALPDETFLLMERSLSTCTLLHSRRRTQEEIDALQIVTIAAFQLFDPYMQEMLRRWNRQSDSIHFVVKSYVGSSYDEEEWNEALTAFSGFKADLLNGVVPDIICLDGVDYQMLSDKGMFEDMRPWMENDPDFHEDEYFMNLFESMSYKGALERMAFSYRATCFMAKSEFAGTEPVQTIESFNALADTLPEGMSMFPTWWSKERVFDHLVTEQLDSFVDYEKGTCCFDTDEFIKLLTLCDSGTTDTTSIRDDYAWKNNKALLQRLDLWMIDNYHTAATVDFAGEPTVLIGVPQVNNEGNGGVF